LTQNLYLSPVNRLKNWLLKPDKAFLLIGLAGGLMFMTLTPPLQVPDEPAHFLRAYQVAEGKLFAERTSDRVGGEVPLSLEKFSHPFWLMIFPGGRISFDSLWRISRMELRPAVTKFKDFNNTALYPPVCYLPQAAGMCIFRAAEASPFFIFYAGRLSNFMVWLIIVWYAIKTIPFGKWLLAMLALLPMSLYVNMSLSADVLTNAVSYLFIATVLKYSQIIITKKELVRLVVLVALLASVKPAYSALTLLVLLIPKGSLPGRSRWLFVTSLFLLAILTSWVWLKTMSYAYITYEQYNPAVRDDLSIVSDASVSGQLGYILSHGSYIFRVIGESVLHAFDMYSTGFIGNFGWLSEPLPGWLVVCGYLVLVLIAISEGGCQLKPAGRILLASTFFIMAALLFLSQHLIWDPVGGPLISNLQGRYFIPFVPLLFLAMGTVTRRKLVAPVAFYSYAICALGFSVVVLAGKYFE
jgi:uncharacterized membrane protein